MLTESVLVAIITGAFTLIGTWLMHKKKSQNDAVKQAVREQGIPFYVSREIPNEETIAAFNEVEETKKNPSIGKSYTDVDKMMEDLLS